MATRSKTKEITIVADKNTFSTIFGKIAGSKDSYDFEGLASLKNLLSKEKARILHILKNKKPSSIYSLAKILGRDFKSVNEDIKVLEKFGFIDLIAEKTGKRSRLRPVIVVDSIKIEIKI